MKRTAGTIAVLSMGAFLVVAQLYLTVPLLPGIAGRYSVSLSTAAWAGSGFGLAYAVGNLVFGTLSDRFDRRWIMLFGLASGAVAAVVAGLSPTFGILLGVRIVQGFLAAAFPPVALAYAVEVLPVHKRAVGLAWISSAFLMAGIGGQAYALWLDEVLGWHWVFWLCAPLLLAVAVLVPRLPAPPRQAVGVRLRDAIGLLRRPPLLMGYLAAVTLLFAFVGMYSGLNAAAHDRYGITGVGPLLLLRLAGLPGVVLCLFAARIIDRHGPHRVGLASFALSAIGLTVEALAHPLWALLVGSALFVAGLAVAVGCAVAVVGAASGASRGAGIAGYGFLVGAGGGIAPLLASSLNNFTELCLVLAATQAVAALAIGFGPRTKSAQTAPEPMPEREVTTVAS
jgi:YNFM family putative membrane transporter